MIQKAGKFAILLLLLSIDYSIGKAQQPKEYIFFEGKEKIKFISYNILNGFDGLKDTDRKNRWVEWIKIQDPEVLALQELVGITETDLQKLAQEYGHFYTAILKENGYPVGLTSKKPIQTITKQTNLFWHGMLHCRTYDMDFIVVHLSPADWQYRHQEAKQITTYIKDKNLSNCLVMGDFNAHSPLDADELESHSDWIKKAVINDAKNTKYKNLRDNQVDYATLSEFLSYPLIDICQIYVPANKRGTFPTRILANCPKNNYRFMQLQERIDFILATPSLRTLSVDAQIYNGTETDYLSDHYPIAIDLIIPLQK